MNFLSDAFYHTRLEQFFQEKLMQARSTQTLRNRNQFQQDDVAVSQELTEAANTLRRLLIKKQLTELLDKETVGCMLATD